MPRTRKKAQASDDMFDPNAVASAKGNPMTESTSGEYAGELYDTHSDLPVHPEDTDGMIPPETAAEEQANDDPSASTPLGRTQAGMTQGQQAAAAELASYMRRMQNLAEDRVAVNTDIKELKTEIKGKGYDLKAFDLILKLDGLTDGQKKARMEQNDVNATYASAVGIDLDLL